MSFPQSSSEDLENGHLSHTSILLLLKEASKLQTFCTDHEGLSPAQHLDATSQLTHGSGLSAIQECGEVVNNRKNCSSAWEAMSLIDQQCERLLRGHKERYPSHCPQDPLTDNDMKKQKGSHQHLQKLLWDPQQNSQVPLRDQHPQSTSHHYYQDLEKHQQQNPCGDTETVCFHSPIRDLNNNITECLNGENDSGTWYGPLKRSSTKPECVDGIECTDTLKGLVCVHSLKCENAVNHEPVQGQEYVNSHSSLQYVSRRVCRKQSRPVCSSKQTLAHSQGVTFTMIPELLPGGESSRLCITHSYRKLRRRSSRSEHATSSEEETHCRKVCASCCTMKTPLWRDAEDGTPLCNACGIRYKKYRVHCPHCWNIPRKEDNSQSQCLKCGDALKNKSNRC